ncbi:MAG: hypothetical protein R2724_05715 [Bryobacterales bacterium]
MSSTCETLFPMMSAGRGRVRGVELFIEKKFTTKWFGQANVSWSRTRHADSTKCAGPALTTIPSSPISWAGGDSAARELARVLFTCAVGPTLPSMVRSREQRRGI